MSKYQIKWAEIGTVGNGKTKATLTLVDEKGTEIDKVTAWADFPNFAELQTGRTVNGNVSVKQNGQYTNKTLYPESTPPAWATNTPAGKGGGIAKAQERKAEGIAKTMDRKEEGIKISSTFRDATLLTIESVKKMQMKTQDGTVVYPPVESVKEEWIMWRKWLWYHWDDLNPPNLPF